MSKDSKSLVVDRGIALHKMIRLVTLATCGGGYLTFMGNEFGHPEWIDFPREGNDWSYKYARRQWSLADDPSLRYHGLEAFDAAMIKYAKAEKILDAVPEQLYINDDSKVLIFKRGNSIFAFNFSPQNSYWDFRFCAPDAEYVMAFSSDDSEFGGFCRLQAGERHCTTGGVLSLYLPCRTAIVLKKN